MRVPAILLATAIVLPGGTASAADIKVKLDPPAPAARRCPPTVNDYLARQMNEYRGPRLAPKKLTELPPATTYMAVLREIGGCDAPLTMVDYRNPRRR
jgi:hypothetical protein